MMKKIGILGANGFLGSYLTKNLQHLGEVIPITRNTVDLFTRDTEDRSSCIKTLDYFDSMKFDYIINCIKSVSHDINNNDLVNIDSLIMDAFLCLIKTKSNFRFINIASGAEFNRKGNIWLVKEEFLKNYHPTDNYGKGKKNTAELCLEISNCYNIRVFGIFSPIHQKTELFNKVYNNTLDCLEERCFDYISIEDFTNIVEYFIKARKPMYNDINAVYSNKHLISEQIRMFCKIHNKDFYIRNMKEGLSYCGSGERLQSLVKSNKIVLKGLDKAMREWKID